MAEPKRVEPNKFENFPKNSADRTRILSYCSAAVDHGELVTELDGKLDCMHEDKQLASLLLQRRDAIQKQARLIHAIKLAVKLKYQPQIPQAFTDRNKGKQSRFKDVQERNARPGKLKKLMSVLEDKNEIQNYLDLEEQKRCIDEAVVNNENGARLKSQTERTSTKKGTELQIKD